MTTTILLSFFCLVCCEEDDDSNVDKGVVIFLLVINFFSTYCHQLLMVLLSNRKQFVFMVLNLWKKLKNQYCCLLKFEFVRLQWVLKKLKKIGYD
jgi:hypothetical protein